MKPIFLALFLMLAIARADAKAAFQSLEQMIATSEAIAVVQIQKTEKISIKGEHWTYGQKATARVERILKGDLPKQIALYGDENFECAQCRFAPGRMLVFLKREGNLWTGNNWHLGAREVKNGRVEWFSDAKGSPFELKSQPHDAVLAEVRKVLASQAKAPQFNLFFEPSKNPNWRVYERKTGAKPLQFSTPELENWIGKLPLGSALILVKDCEPGDEADAETRANLKNLCRYRGVQWQEMGGG